MGGIGLVLSGGGARGAYEAGVLGYIFGDLAKREGRTPPLAIVSGTSVGAVNGAFIASRAHDLSRSVARLEALWCDLELSDVLDFTLRHAATLPRVLLGGDDGSGLFSSAALRALAAREIDWDRLDMNLERGVRECGLRVRGRCGAGIDDACDDLRDEHAEQAERQPQADRDEGRGRRACEQDAGEHRHGEPDADVEDRDHHPGHETSDLARGSVPELKGCQQLSERTNRTRF